MVDGPLYSRFIILRLDNDGESRSCFSSFFFRWESLSSDFIAPSRRTETQSDKSRGEWFERLFFFFSIVIESLRWSENESRNNLLRFPARPRPPGSFCCCRRRRRCFCCCPRHRWQWFELWKMYVCMRYATTKMILAFFLCVYTLINIAILRLFSVITV